MDATQLLLYNTPATTAALSERGTDELLIAPADLAYSDDSDGDDGSEGASEGGGQVGGNGGRLDVAAPEHLYVGCLFGGRRVDQEDVFDHGLRHVDLGRVDPQVTCRLAAIAPILR